MDLPGVTSEGSWRETESCDVLREGGPTKRVGAGRRLGLVLAVGDGLVGFEGCDSEAMIAIVEFQGE